MKLYTHPVSTACRPVMQFIADNNIPVDMEVVDILKGEHFQPAYSDKNPNRLIPMLEDGDFRLTESAAILRYLAEKTGLPAYPKDLKQRAKVNEMMDWLNTNFYRDYAYGFIYPQVFPHHRRPSDEMQSGTVAWGKERTEGWLRLLNDYWIGPTKPYLCGDRITIADYFGSGLVSLGELIGCDFSKYPNVDRWLNNMKQLKTWPKINEVFYGFKDSLKGKRFQYV
jgi:glutathione S-transferase